MKSDAVGMVDPDNADMICSLCKEPIVEGETWDYFMGRPEHTDCFLDEEQHIVRWSDEEKDFADEFGGMPQNDA